MATVTKQLAVLDAGNVQVEFDYDDSTMRVQAVRCINNSGSPVYANASRSSDGLSYSHTFPANTTQYFSIPQTPAARFTLTVTESGKLSGVTYSIWQ